MTDNKIFWRTIELCLSDKSKNSERIVLKENNIMVTKDDNVAPTLNVFSNIAASLNMLKFKDCDPFSERMSRPALSAIFQYTNHASIGAIEKCNRYD